MGEALFRDYFDDEGPSKVTNAKEVGLIKIIKVKENGNMMIVE